MSTKHKRTERARVVGVLALQTWVGVQPIWTVLSLTAPKHAIPIGLYVAVLPAAYFAHLANRKGFHGAATLLGLSVFALTSAPFAAGSGVAHLEQVALAGASHKFAVTAGLLTVYSASRIQLLAHWAKALGMKVWERFLKVFRDLIRDVIREEREKRKGRDR